MGPVIRVLVVYYIIQTLSQQFDALCSFYLNVGINHFANSTLMKLLKNDPNDPAIANEFPKWKCQQKAPKPGKERKPVVCEELVKRRAEEAALYFSQD